MHIMELDELPKKKPQIIIGENLELMSMTELEQRVQELESEIERVKTVIASKRASKSAADSLFRT
jgi:uncharacterized small protein (DUF1192 family)